MPGISTDIDTAAGSLIPSQSFVRVDNELVIVKGDGVESHSPCGTVPVHCAATMSNSSSFVNIDGVGVVIQGNSASCGHTATGQNFFQISN